MCMGLTWHALPHWTLCPLVLEPKSESTARAVRTAVSVQFTGALKAAIS